jgi:hypothetical protein
MPRSRRDPPVNPSPIGEFISRQQERLLAEVAALCDDVRVQSAVTSRLDTMIGQMLNIQTGMLEQIRAMVAQHQRADQLSRLWETRQ